MYIPTCEDEIHTCHTEVQGRPALIVRTNTSPNSYLTNSLGSDEFLRKEIREGFLKMKSQMDPEEWENFHWLGIRTDGENRPVVWIY